jgi:hypothetical protein
MTGRVCCAIATGGHTAPAISAMNSRRLIANLAPEVLIRI